MTDITIRRPIQWLSSSATNVGTVRTINEDAILARPEIGMWVVADGMGGHAAGNVASKMVVDTLAEIAASRHLNDFVTSIENQILDTNRRLLEYAEIMLDGGVVGSTFICMLIRGQVGVCLWAGDSRLYLYRNNQLTRLSRDHSHVAELVQQGAITAEEALVHPESNVITRAVGTNEELIIDIELFSVQVGDVYLLCSDGLYNAVANLMIEKHLASDTVDESVEGLIESALFNNASDNVSVIVVKGVRQEVN
jgi:serine/threonine protein phosphatase PrpC